MPDRDGYYTTGEAHAARDEDGEQVARIVCRICGQPTIGRVQRSSAGLVFDARGETPRLPADVLSGHIARANAAGIRLPIPGMVRTRTTVLLEQQRRPRTDEPKVLCATHGVIPLDGDAIVAAVRTRPNRKILTITATPSPAV